MKKPRESLRGAQTSDVFSGGYRRAQLHQGAVRATQVGHDLPPGFLRRRRHLAGAGRDGLGVRGRHVVRDQRNLETQRLCGRVRVHMPAGKVHVTQRVRGERQRGLAGVEFAVGAAFVQELARDSESPLEEGQRGRDVGDVDDGVAEFHGIFSCFNRTFRDLR